MQVPGDFIDAEAASSPDIGDYIVTGEKGGFVFCNGEKNARDTAERLALRDGCMSYVFRMHQIAAVRYEPKWINDGES